MTNANGSREIRAFAPTGMVGSGFSEDSFQRALTEFQPDFIGADAGSTDGGPHELAAGTAHFAREAVKRDIRLMIEGGLALKVPVLIGSIGTAGADVHLEWGRKIVEEIARERGLSFKLGLIGSQQDKDYLKKRLAEGRISALKPELPLNDEIIDRSIRIVGVAGVEPFIQAVDEGAQVVIAGRSSDTSIFAAMAVRAGLRAGPAWHAAKILECGAAAATERTRPDGMMARITDEGFTVEPANISMRCSTVSVAAHNLYENATPTILLEPSGHLDTSQALYTQLDDRSVMVTGSQFVPADRYSIKLEGVEAAGYQTISIGGVRDPLILRQLDTWLSAARQQTDRRLEGYLPHGTEYDLRFRIYGRNGTMGNTEPITTVEGHEVCVIIEATAPSQDIATDIAATASHAMLHTAIPEWTGLITTLAYPYSPNEIERGPIYRFNLNHIVYPDDPLEMFGVEVVDVEGR